MNETEKGQSLNKGQGSGKPDGRTGNGNGKITENEEGSREKAEEVGNQKQGQEREKPDERPGKGRVENKDKEGEKQEGRPRKTKVEGRPR